MRTQPERHGPDDTLKSILSLLEKKLPQSSSPHGFKTSILNKQPQYIQKPSDLETFKQVYDWHFMFLSSAKENSPDLKIFIGEYACKIFALCKLPNKLLVYCCVSHDRDFWNYLNMG